MCTLFYTYVLMCTLDIHVCTKILLYNSFHNALEGCNIAEISESRSRKFSKSLRIAARICMIEKKSVRSMRNLYQNLFQTKLSNFGFFHFRVGGGGGGGGGHTALSYIDIKQIKNVTSF